MSLSHLSFIPQAGPDVRFNLPASRPQSLPTLNDLLLCNQWPLSPSTSRAVPMQPSSWQDSFTMNNLNICRGTTSGCSSAPSSSAVQNFLSTQLQQMQQFQHSAAAETLCARSYGHSSTSCQEPSTSSRSTFDQEFQSCSSWQNPTPASPESGVTASSPSAANKIFPRRKAGQAFRVHSKPVVLNEKVLRQYFDLPLHEAAVQLGISATAMKSACRKCGISKWPYRTVTAKAASSGGALRPRVPRTPSASSSTVSGGSGSDASEPSSPAVAASNSAACGPPPLSPTDACHSVLFAPPAATASVDGRRCSLAEDRPSQPPQPLHPQQPPPQPSSAGSLWAILN